MNFCIRSIYNHKIGIFVTFEIFNHPPYPFSITSNHSFIPSMTKFIRIM